MVYGRNGKEAMNNVRTSSNWKGRREPDYAALEAMVRKLEFILFLGKPLEDFKQGSDVT